MKTCGHDGCSRRVQARGLCTTHYSVWQRNRPLYTITCAHCGTTKRVGMVGRRYCSTACANAEKQVKMTAAASEARSTARLEREALKAECWRQQTLPVVYAHRFAVQNRHLQTKKASRRFTSGQCIRCQSWFVSTNAAHKTCSPECQAANQADNIRAGKQRRRAIKMAAFVENVYRKAVFERDGYRCHLCRRKTNPNKQAPHPKAPTIDHVVPLAQGGTHEPLNCRTACFLCNSRKGDRGHGEQLLLIA